MKKRKVTILGATGTVGQQFIHLLRAHPWFEVGAVCASEQSAGMRYGERVQWMLSDPCPSAVAEMEIQPVTGSIPGPLVFSALDANVAGPLESRLAEEGFWVISNAKNHRMHPDVPLLIPEVNAHHLALLDQQPWSGRIVTNPNCATVGLVLAMLPLLKPCGVRAAHVVTMQAISGAGYPGVPALAIFDNLIPHISGEEEKLCQEPRKLLASWEQGQLREADLAVSAACYRVPVLDGHTLHLSLELAEPLSLSAIRSHYRQFISPLAELALPSAPKHPVYFFENEDLPQPRKHRLLENGMAVSVGRLRPSIAPFHCQMTTLSHNTVRGAAGGAILNAELIVRQGFLDP
jgi:aspartate-semialdehyde dehydrogenase